MEDELIGWIFAIQRLRQAKSSSTTTAKQQQQQQ
jgi:hypothetical protein